MWGRLITRWQVWSAERAEANRRTRHYLWHAGDYDECPEPECTNHGGPNQ